ncbi:BON domain-containing protein [Pseudomonas knackmussii]|uniref:BON domain-containing protein n=1 Tax=Pseudomonas knackmussii TaxID=65741 RepID=UPI003BCB4A20
MRERRPWGAQDATDVRLEKRIVTLYAQRAELRTSSLVAFVHAGRATLSGMVDEDFKRRLAAQFALDVPGVRAVRSQALASALCGGKRGSAPTRWPWVAIVCFPTPGNDARAG